MDLFEGLIRYVGAAASAVAAIATAVKAIKTVNKARGTDKGHDRRTTQHVPRREVFLIGGLWVLAVAFLLLSGALLRRTGGGSDGVPLTTKLLSPAEQDSRHRLTVSREVDSLIAMRQGLIRNEQFTSSAFDALNHQRYEAALQIADRCIAEFGPRAEQEQAKLTAAHMPLPPTGKISAAEKEEILSRAILNDVTACHWIKGRAAESLGRRDLALPAFQAAQRYSYGRTWDPTGEFLWSPSEDAANRLARLQ